MAVIQQRTGDGDSVHRSCSWLLLSLHARPWLITSMLDGLDGMSQPPTACKTSLLASSRIVCVISRLILFCACCGYNPARGSCSLGDDVRTAGLANAWGSCQQHRLLGHVLGLALQQNTMHTSDLSHHVLLCCWR